MRRMQLNLVLGVIWLIAIALPARAQSIPDYDFQWATIGDVGNPNWVSDDPNVDPLSPTQNRGQVNYEYRISKLEVTTGQWIEFVNNFSTTQGNSFFAEPGSWGAEPDPNYGGPGIRWRPRTDHPNPTMVPINGVSWLSAAQFCNWLHNGKQSTWESITTGAYDTTKLILNENGQVISDTITRSPDAKYWIPTLDEWQKAAHWDPNKFGEGQGGWWKYPTTSDTAPTPGVPGTPGAQTSAGVPSDGSHGIFPRYFELGSYPDITSPWGLLDTSGGAREWVEDANPFIANWRTTRGTSAESPFLDFDSIDRGQYHPATNPAATLRLATSIPSPSSMVLFGLGSAFILRRRIRCGSIGAPRTQRFALSTSALITTVAALSSSAYASGIAPDYDFQWATIGAVGNQPYFSSDPEFPNFPPYNSTQGRGRVDYEYRISKLEVTTGQWIEFVNNFSTTSNENAFFAMPTSWGGEPDPNYGGPGIRWRPRTDVANPTMVPLIGISWYDAARFCNWLHNGKQSTWEAITTGAYDTTGLKVNGGDIIDQITRMPEAKYWIPTLDEAMKAAFYDPDRYGKDQGGWWNYPTTSDTVPTPGLPGTPGAQTSNGLPTSAHPRFIPLGSYPDVTSPWGLLDTSGGAREWIEDQLNFDWRAVIGTSAGGVAPWYDTIDWAQDAETTIPAGSFRVVTAIPTPTSALLFITGVVILNRRNRT